MKTIEALISLLVLLSFASVTLIQPVQPGPSLQEYQLAEDAWRIAYLKGCFNQSVPSLKPDHEMRECLLPVFEEINRQTSLKLSCDTEIQVAVGEGLPREGAVLIKKTVILNGVPAIVEMRAG